MTKKDFIAIADAIREHDRTANHISDCFRSEQLNTLADAFQRINPRFNRSRWLDYIAGKCGPNGGAR